jgi:hypothetical protein
MNLQAERTYRSYSKFSVSDYRIPDCFNQVLIDGMDTRRVCSEVLISEYRAH